jgi:hypothetical protein
VPQRRNEPRKLTQQEKLWEQLKYVVANGVRDPTRVMSNAQELTMCGPNVQSFLQWAADLEAEKQRLQSEIELHDGYADVWVLFDLGGTRINAEVVNGTDTAQWEILNAFGQTTGVRFPYRPQDAKDLEKKGFQEVYERQPAVAMIVFGRSDANWPRVEAVVKPNCEGKE